MPSALCITMTKTWQTAFIRKASVLPQGALKLQDVDLTTSRSSTILMKSNLDDHVGFSGVSCRMAPFEDRASNFSCETCIAGDPGVALQLPLYGTG